MELHVGGADRHPVTPPGGRLTFGDVVVQPPQAVRVDVRERPDHVALDGAPQPVEVDQVGLVELTDEHAAVHLVDQQALVGQQPKRLAERVA